MDPMGMLVCFPECSPFKMLFQLMVPRMGGGVVLSSKDIRPYSSFSLHLLLHPIFVRGVRDTWNFLMLLPSCKIHWPPR